MSHTDVHAPFRVSRNMKSFQRENYISDEKRRSNRKVRHDKSYRTNYDNYVHPKPTPLSAIVWYMT